MCRLTSGFASRASRGVASVTPVPGALGPQLGTQPRAGGGRGDDGAQADRRGRLHLSDPAGRLDGRAPNARPVAGRLLHLPRQPSGCVDGFRRQGAATGRHAGVGGADEGAVRRGASSGPGRDACRGRHCVVDPTGRGLSAVPAAGSAGERVAAAVAEFKAEYGRPPTAPEHKKLVAREARRERRPVAGFDLVFTPVKCASLLWGLGGPETRRLVEQAHHEAVASTVGWLEKHAAFTRAGHGGTAQIDTTGLVCAAFDHRDSRSGDPDLHTHVAVAKRSAESMGSGGPWTPADCTLSVWPRRSGTTHPARGRPRASVGGGVCRTPRHRAGEAAGPGDHRGPTRAGPAFLEAACRDRGPLHRTHPQLPGRARSGAGPVGPAEAGPAGHLGDPGGQGTGPHPWPSRWPTGPSKRTR